MTEPSKHMIGLLVITHYNVGKELLSAAELIVGRIEAAEAIAITDITNNEEILEMISNKVQTLDKGKGVLILTDMFGGTPSNLSLPFLNEEKIQVLTGVNLPMIIAVVQERDNLSLTELGEKGEEAGKRSIALAGKLLEPK